MAFKLRLQPGNHLLELFPGETLLQGVLRLGYQVPYGCRNGICGACQAQLLSGTIRYSTQSEEQRQALAQGLVYCCQARLDSDVELHWEPIIAPQASRLSRYLGQLLALDALPGNVWRVRLKLDTYDFPRFFAGQYLQLILTDGSKRPFSIASSPRQPWLELHIRHQPGNSWTGQVLEELRQHQQIHLELPLGEAYWQSTTRQVLFLAGGTGFAPIKAMIDSLPEGLTQQPCLYWGAVTESGLYQHAQAQDWHQQQRIRLVACLDKPEPGWLGYQGSALTALLQEWPDLSGCDLYVAGREELVWAAYQAALAQGLPTERFFSDTVNLARQANE